MNKKGLNKYFIGFLILVILSASVYILLPNQVRIDVQDTKTTFKVYENNSWILSGTEYTKLYDGSTLMKANNRVVNYTINNVSNTTNLYRYSYFKDGIIAIDNYTFDGSTKDKELFPISHTITCINCSKKILVYEVNDLLYTGNTTNGITSPQSFGHKMKVEWEDGNYYSRIYKYSGKDIGKLEIKYKPITYIYTKEVRLFDPDYSEYWLPNSTIIGGVPYKTYEHQVIETFEKDSSIYLMSIGSGTAGGSVTCRVLASNGTTWLSNGTGLGSICMGLPGVPKTTGGTIGLSVYNTSLTDFHILIGGYQQIYGYSWNGSGWERNDSVNNSIPYYAYSYLPEAFYIGNDLYLITAKSDNPAAISGFAWNGSGWETNATIIQGLTAYRAGVMRVNDRGDGKISLIRTVSYLGYEWNGNNWSLDSSIISGLNPPSTSQYPIGTMFYNGNDWYYIYSREAGGLSGFIRIEDTNPPTYEVKPLNNSAAGQITRFGINVMDNSVLHPIGQWIFSTNNSGAWINDTAINFTTTPSWANTTKILNSTEGLLVGYRWYFNDSAGLTNSTPIYTLTTLDSTPPNITIRSPLNNSMYSTLSILVNLTGNVTGDYIWYNNGTGNYTYTNPINVTFAEGINKTLWVYANDSFPNNFSTFVRFNIDVSPPTISIIPPSPENNTAMNYLETIINVSIYDLNFNTSILRWNEPNSASSFNDSSINGNISFSGNQTYKRYLRIPKTATPLSGTLTLDGYYTGNWSARTVREQQTSQDAETSIRGNSWLVQNINITGANQLPSSVKIWSYRVGMPGNITISIRATNGTGYPIGPDLVSGTVNASTWSSGSSGAWNEVIFDTHEFIAINKTNYSIVIRVPNGDLSNKVNIKYKSSGTYTGGFVLDSVDGGTSWTPYTSMDLGFQELGTAVSYPIQSWLEVGTLDGDYEWSYYNPYNISQTTSDFATELNASLNNGLCNVGGATLDGDICVIPFSFHSMGYGKLEYSNITISYAWGGGATNYTMSCFSNETYNYICSKTILNSTYGMDYTFSLWANDSNGNYYETGLYTLISDKTSPQFQNLSVNPANGSQYTSGLTWFNVTINEANINTYGITFNGTNYTGNNLSYVYSFPYHTVKFNRTALLPGTYNYTWWAIDLLGKYNSTSNQYIVLKAPAIVYTYINGTRANWSINQNTNLTLNGTLNSGTGNIYLYKNGTLLNYGTPTIQNLTNFTEPGYFNISTMYPGNAYFFPNYETLFVQVNDTVKPNVTLVSPLNDSKISSLTPKFNVSVTDNYDLANLTVRIYNVTSGTELTNNVTILSTAGVTSYNLSFNYTFLGEGDFKWFAYAFDRNGNNFTTENKTFSIVYYPDITLINPLSESYVVRVSLTDFYVPLNASFIHLGDKEMNISYWDNATGEQICNSSFVTTGSFLECNWTKEFGGSDEVNSWYINATDDIRTVMSPIYTFTIRDIKLKNVDIYPINENDINISWDNWPEQKWVTFYVWNLDGTLAVTNFAGTEDEIHGSQYMTGLQANTEYRLEWQTGYLEVEGDFYSMYFRTAGWDQDLNDWGYKRLITVDHTSVIEDSNETILNITLTDENFVYYYLWSPYSDFYNVNAEGTDIRFTDYYEKEDLEYNITRWDVPASITIDQWEPDAESYVGDYIETSYCHDNNWNSRCIANPYGVQYFNYTIPVGAKTSSVLRMYAGEYYWDGPIPVDCFGGTDLQFKVEQNYSRPSVDVFCRNNLNQWELAWNNGNVSSYWYESQVTWKFPASVNILVKTTHFDDFLQSSEIGMDADYDVKLWMYYGNPSATSEETTFDYTDVTSTYTLGDQSTYVTSAPVISNFNDSLNRTTTQTNISWSTNQVTDSRIMLSLNPWYLDYWYAYREHNRKEEFLDISGSVNTTTNLPVSQLDWIDLVDVTCSVPTYCNNYSINLSTDPISIRFIDSDYAGNIDWNVTYTTNGTNYLDSFNPSFLITDLNPSVTYYYRVISTGPTGINSTQDGSFLLGTVYNVPVTSIINYTEDRPNSQINITANLSDLKGYSSANVSIQYWVADLDTTFTETSVANLSSIGTYTWTINQTYGNIYNYRVKVQVSSSVIGYSEMYQNEFMLPQQFFAGSYIRDDADYRHRQYCTKLIGNELGQVNSSDCYEQTGVREGSRQDENWIYIESNVTSFGNLTVNLVTGMDYSNITQYNMSYTNVGNFSYLEINDLSMEWYSLYITNYTGHIVLNWTKPGLWRPFYGTRIDDIKWVYYNQPHQDIDYTQMYLWPAGYDTESYTYCMLNGGDLFSCMSVESWGYDWLPESMVGTDYDRGNLFAGGVINGGHRDTGFQNETLPYYNLTSNDLGIGIPGPDLAYNNTGRYCFAFANYYWQGSFTPENDITNYYVRFWTLTDFYSTYYGYKQPMRFDSFCMKAYDDTTGEWGGLGVQGCFEGTVILPEDITIADTATPDVFQTPYNTNLYVFSKDFSATPIDVSDDKIYDIEPYFDAQWVNQLSSKYTPAFIIYNLPSDEVLATMDTDLDEVNDYDELYVHYTDPFSIDTDNDGVNDYIEITISQTNPNKPTDGEIANPVLSEYQVTPSNNTAYLALTNYKFSVTVTEQNLDKIIFTFNGTNYTSAYNTTTMNETYSTTYEINFTGIPAGVYNYSWYANDSFTNDYHSIEMNYVIAEAVTFEGNITLQPFMYNTLNFYPTNSTSKAVQPRNQSITEGSFIAYNNNTFDGLLVIRLEAIYNTSWGGNIILKANDEYNYSSATIVYSYFGTVNSNYSNLILANSAESKYIWLWADYYSPQRVWSPNLDIMIQEAGD